MLILTSNREYCFYANTSVCEHAPPLFNFPRNSDCLCCGFVWGNRHFGSGCKDGCILVSILRHKWLSAVNYVNLTECRFRSFSALANTTDLDPVKQKKADVIGLRKSSRGIKPHPVPSAAPSPPPQSLSKKSLHLSTLQAPVRRTLWSQRERGHFDPQVLQDWDFWRKKVKLLDEFVS